MFQDAVNEPIIQEIFEHNPTIALRIAGNYKNGTVLYVSRNIANYGYSQDDFTSGNRTWTSIVHPEDLEELGRQVEQYTRLDVNHYNLQYRICKESGEHIWVNVSCATVRDRIGKILYTDCVVLDYTKIKENNDKIADNSEQQDVLNDILHTLLHSDLDSSLGILQIILNQSGNHLNISRVVLFEDDEQHLTGKAIYEWCNQGIPSLLEPGDFILDYTKDIPEIEKDLHSTALRAVHYGQIPTKSTKFFKQQGIISCVICAIHLQGKRFGLISFSECKESRNWSQTTLSFLETISKLTSTALLLQASREHIERLAYYDHLTKLPNRYRCDDYLASALNTAINKKQSSFVLFIDMDDFKIINDGYGHDYGDALLVEFSDFLRNQFCPEHQVFRFGGDEFIIVVENTYTEYIHQIAEQLLERARLPWNTLDRKFYCTISVGIVRFPDHDYGVKDIIKNADVAMYQAKKLGKNNYVFYSNSLNNNSIERAEMEHLMRDAINNDFEGFQVYYQPIFNANTGHVLGTEALIRWFDPKGRQIMPNQFISLAEYLGLIIPLGEFVLRTAACQCKKINDNGCPNFTMNINVSIRQFQQPDIVSRFKSILKETGVSTSNIIFEVTEGLVMHDLQRILAILREFRDMGIQIAMDDFGTGYSSLSSMRAVPFDIIKIDRAFIRDITVDAYAKSFIRLIADLSHSMEKEVCIEGVETPQQLAYCQGALVDVVQGFLFSPALSSQDLEARLADLSKPNYLIAPS